MQDEKEKSLQERFQEVFGGSVGGDDEKLLELASSFSVQLSANQIRVILALYYFSDVLEVGGKLEQGKVLKGFVERYLKLKKFHGSDFFVQRALDSISLRRFMEERPIGVDVVKR